MRNRFLTHATPADAPITAFACLWCVIVFAFISGGDNTWEAVAYFGYYPQESVWTGQPWALLSSAFVHLDWWHLALNLYWIWILGSCFEISQGWWRCLLFIVVSAWVSSASELMLGGNMGIGMSGVGYALFGFGWVARNKEPRFADILDDTTVMGFLTWLVFCVVLTKMDVMPIANWAHLFGLIFGLVTGGLFVLRWRPLVCATGLVLLLAGSCVPLKWCPFSPDWTGIQAEQAHDRKDFDVALGWYQRSLSLGSNPSWAWSNMAVIYGFQEKKSEYANALRELRKVNEKSAQEVEADYGKP